MTTTRPLLEVLEEYMAHRQTTTQEIPMSTTTIPSTDTEAISQVIDGLLAAGVTITTVQDGAGEEFPFTDKAAAIEELTSCDSGALEVRLPGGMESFVYFILGNSPEEVVADHGVALSEFIDPIVTPWWS